MPLFGRRTKPEDAFLQTAAAVIQGDQLSITEFTSLGDIARRLISDTWSVQFLDPNERRRLTSQIPDIEQEFEAFLKATVADPRRAATIRKPWFAAWIHGFFLGLARLHRENTELGRVPPHTWESPPTDTVLGIWAHLGRLGGGDNVERIDRELEWMGYGALAPFSARVMQGAVAFIGAAEDDEMVAQYESGPPRIRALMMLRVSVARGYALARAQQENALMGQFLAELAAQ